MKEGEQQSNGSLKQERKSLKERAGSMRSELLYLQ